MLSRRNFAECAFVALSRYVVNYKMSYKVAIPYRGDKLFRTLGKSMKEFPE
jgi:hypothetical protein